MTNIIQIVEQQQKEQRMAKARIQQTPVEAARIVFYYEGLQNSFMVRYADMKTAEKEFVKFCDAEEGTFVLTGAASTAVIEDMSKVCMKFLVHVENDRHFAVDDARRGNAMMQLP